MGLSILKKGGNAADACVAMAAALNVTQPCSTGIGGDCFCLFYDSSTGKVEGLNGTGRCPSALSTHRLREEFGVRGESLPAYSAHTVTVPGTAAAWVDTTEKFGSGNLSLKEILLPAIEMAENGFPVHPVAALQWADGVDQLLEGPYADEMLLDGRAPRAGEIMKIPFLARTFREVAEKGKAGFYEGRVAEAIVEV